MNATVDWDDAFSNGAYISGAANYPQRWAAAATAFRATARGACDLRYGDGSRETFDVFLPETPPKGLFVFIHGGYWLAFDKSDWSHLAAGALAHGWAAAMIGYPLCPQARVAEITAAVGRGVAAASARVAGPIVIAGHSAGGHLAARFATSTPPVSNLVHDRIDRVAPISGLFDLRPLMGTRMNATLKLDAAEAEAESPALSPQAAFVRTVPWVGERERPEFHRQAGLLATAWDDAEPRIAPGRHHFDVIDLLADPESDLMQSILA